MKAIHAAALIAVAFALIAISVPVYASDTDDGIESSVKKCYVFKTFLKEDDIRIQSRDGVVTLSGTVSEEAHKKLAQETVAAFPGVKSVDNRLELKGEAGDRGSDELVAGKAKLELLSHRNLSATRTDVQVKDGVVTLRGEAGSQAQIDLATEYIRDVEGVRDVKNEMTVSEAHRTPGTKTMSEKAGDVGNKIGHTAGEVGEWVDDASITALVKATLLYHRSTSVLNTTVETIEGVVNLGGTARNASEKDLVTKLVHDVHGVKSVKNRMTIE